MSDFLDRVEHEFSDDALDALERLVTAWPELRRGYSTDEQKHAYRAAREALQRAGRTVGT